jgi:serine/threonine protein kinase
VERGGRPFQHEVGQRIQLVAGEDPLEVVDRRAGYFGAVYALEAPTGAITAVKTPRADILLDREATDRFVEEARIWIGIPHHPMILSAYRILSYAERPYVHIAYVPPINSYGSSVASLLAELPPTKLLNLTSVWSTISKLAQALCFIEEWDQAFVHGDIKPENLLVEVEGGTGGSLLGKGPEATEVNVVLSDFGMARAAASLGPTRTGDLNYLAPEALRAIRESSGYGGDKPSDLGGKAIDMYAIGCTMFELLYGVPHQLVEPETGVALYAFGASPSPQRLLVPERPDLRLPFAELVAKCLDADPARRPQTYADFYAQLVDAVESSGGSWRYVSRSWTSLPEGHVEATSSALAAYLVDRYGISTDLATLSLEQLVLASSLRSLRSMPESDAVLAELTSRLPDLATVESSVAQNLIVHDERDAACTCLRKAISSYEGDPRLAELDSSGFSSACCNLAQLLSAPGSTSPEEALRHSETALSLQPGASKIHLARGMALQRAGRVEEARAALTRAREIDPPNPRIAEMWLCCELLRMIFWEGATKKTPAVGKAIDEAPLSNSEKRRSARLAILLAKALFAEGKLPSAHRVQASR